MLLTGAGEANQAAETAHVLRWAKLKHSKNREPDICLWFVSWKRDVTVIAISCLQGAKARGWSSTRSISRLPPSPSSSFSRSPSPRRRRTGSRARRRRRSATRGRMWRRRGSRRGGRCLGEASCSAQERNLWRNCQTWWPEPEQRFIITAMKKWHLTTNQMISVGSSLPPTRSHSILPPRFHSSRRQRRERHATCRGGRRGRRFFFIFINFFIIANFNGNFYIVMPCHQFSDIHHCHQVSTIMCLKTKSFATHQWKMHLPSPHHSHHHLPHPHHSHSHHQHSHSLHPHQEEEVKPVDITEYISPSGEILYPKLLKDEVRKAKL